MSAISSSSGAGSSASSRAGSDYEVKTIEHQIQDWKCCPTTDPQTKREIVDKLQIKLDSIKAGIEQQSQERARMQEVNLDTSRSTGLGTHADVLA